MTGNVERDDPSTHEEDNPSKAAAQYSEQWWEVRNHVGRCKAHRKNGERCRRPKWAMATTCGHHGARAPQVRRKARQRLEEATDRMAMALLKMAVDPDVADAVKLRAITEALDRGNLSAKTEIEISTSPFQQIGDVLSARLEIGGSRAEFRRSQGIEDQSDEADPLAKLREQDMREANREDLRAVGRNSHLVIDAEVVSESSDVSGFDGRGYPDAHGGRDQAASGRTPGEAPPPGGIPLVEAAERVAEIRRVSTALVPTNARTRPIRFNGHVPPG